MFMTNYVSGMSEIAACPPSPIANNPSALPSPTFSPSSISNSSYLFTRCQPLCARCGTFLLYFSRSCTVRLKLFSLFLCLFLMYYFYEKYYTSITVKYYRAYCQLGIQANSVGLTNMLSEWTLFIYRALTVYGNSLQQQQKTNVSTYGCSI